MKNLIEAVTTSPKDKQAKIDQNKRDMENYLKNLQTIEQIAATIDDKSPMKQWLTTYVEDAAKSFNNKKESKAYKEKLNTVSEDIIAMVDVAADKDKTRTPVEKKVVLDSLSKNMHEDVKAANKARKVTGAGRALNVALTVASFLLLAVSLAAILIPAPGLNIAIAIGAAALAVTGLILFTRAAFRGTPSVLNAKPSALKNAGWFADQMKKEHQSFVNSAKSGADKSDAASDLVKVEGDSAEPQEVMSM